MYLSNVQIYKQKYLSRRRLVGLNTVDYYRKVDYLLRLILRLYTFIYIRSVRGVSTLFGLAVDRIDTTLFLE